MLTTLTMHAHGSSVIIVNCSLSYQRILVPWFCVAGRFELMSWSMFSDGRFLPVEVKHMIVTDKVTQWFLGLETFRIMMMKNNGYLDQNHIAMHMHSYM